MSYNMGGLKVEDGRLINEDPSPHDEEHVIVFF